jgi:hypothetical protein
MRYNDAQTFDSFACKLTAIVEAASYSIRHDIFYEVVAVKFSVFLFHLGDGGFHLFA